MPTPIQLSQISLRKGERGGAICLGGSEAGKSYLADLLGLDWVGRYQSSGGRRLILDTKPRYRAEWEITGLPAKRRYRSWDHGQPVRGSVLLENPRDLERAFRISPTVIVQTESGQDLGRQIAAAELFLRSSRSARPQLLQVDEVLDFFHGNGAARGGNDVIMRSSRAGGERGTLPLFCSQRTKGIPQQILAEIKRCYLFLLDFESDAARLQECGAPAGMLPPQEPFEFYYWFKKDRHRVWGPYKVQPNPIA